MKRAALVLLLLLPAAAANGAETRSTLGGKAATSSPLKKGVRAGTGVVGTTTGTVAPLTVSECVALGGEIRLTDFCNTGHRCLRHDENGIPHSVCISEIR